MIIINGSIYFVFDQVTKQGELDRLKREAVHIMEGLNQEGAETIDPATLLQPSLPANGMIRVINQQSKVIIRQEVDSQQPIPVKDTHFDHRSTNGIYENKGIAYVFVRVPIIWSDGKVALLEVTESLEEPQKNLALLKNVLVIASLVVLIPTFIAGRLLSNFILRPVNSLIQTMEDIATRGIFKKIPLEKRSQDELYKMGNTFNKMMDLLQQNFEKQQQFVSDASHELKTPLTIIESYAKLLKRWGTMKPEILEEAVEAIYSEAVRMKQMTNQMLMLANNQAEWKVEMKDIDAVSLCRSTAEQLEKAYHRPIQVQTTSETIPITTDEQKLKQILVILLDNAIKYSTKSIELTVDQQVDGIFLSVMDYGMGIPKADLDHVFDRFFRVDKARNRDTGGTGLGLSIARKMVDALDGQIQVESEEGQWTRMTVFIPSHNQG
nr:ATP-binding protein [Bacillus sp. REN10]